MAVIGWLLRTEIKIRAFLRRRDAAFQCATNNIFSTNSPRRYLFGLSSVAVLICVAQLSAQLPFYLPSDFVLTALLLKALGLFFTLVSLLLLALVALYFIRPSLRQLQEEIEAHSKFLRRMGGEIQRYAASILSATDLLQTSDLSQQQETHVASLSRSSKSLLSVLNNLIDYSRITSGKVMLEYCELDVLNTVQDCINIAANAANQKMLELHLHVDPKTSLRVTSDPLLLQQVLLNLLENSVKFTERGKIELSIWQTNLQNQVRLHFRVSDTGTGINADKLVEIFDYFQQEDPAILRKYGGSGLGLGIALELVKLTGGQIEARSQKGAGSEFHFFLPIKHFSEKSFQDIFSAQSMKNKKAFLLEDIAERKIILSNYVKSFGGEVTTEEFSTNENVPVQEYWLSYFEKNHFDIYIINYEQYPAFVDHLKAAQGSENNLLSKLVLLSRSTLSPEKIQYLNSSGVKIFCYIPIKPVEFLSALTLALAPPHQAQRPNSPHPATSKSLVSFELATPIAALIVDDSRDNQFLMKKYLEKHCRTLVTAEDGREAFEKFKKHPFDIVLMDIAMPNISGHEAVRQMRSWEREQKRTPIPILAVSSQASDDEREMCLRSGFTSHIAKPVDLAELQLVMKSLFQGKSNMILQSENSNLAWQLDLKKYLPNYYRQREEDLRALQLAAETEDWGKIVFIGHKIKGSAATYGFPELGQACAELETLGADHNLSQVKGKIAYIEQWLKKVNPQRNQR